MSEEKKRLSAKDIKDIEFFMCPDLLIDAVDFLQEVATELKFDADDLLIMSGFKEADKKKVDLASKNAIKFFLDLGKLFIKEYDRENKKSGKKLSKTIKLISDATDVKMEVLEKTDYRVLITLFKSLFIEPQAEVEKSFLS
jgi:CRISPR/Cas system CSM-associated protein Csm4 (group 5 of RAMP superfamily)